MNENAQAYPLQWPAGWPRTANLETAGGNFRATLSSALNSLRDEVRKLGGINLVLSSNCTLGTDKPKDPAVVAYFTLRGRSYAIPCDRWRKVEHNVRAIALTIEAMRGMERWGAKNMIEAMFAGFKALPGKSADRAWWDVLGIPRNCSKATVEAAYREKAKSAHPDVGGSTKAMAELNQAREDALRSFQGGAQ